MKLEQYIKKNQRLVNKFLDGYFNEKKTNSECPKRLCKSMNYSLMAGGKRLRPILAIASYEASGGKTKKHIVPVAAALEMIHTYSLIHDDLPSMDNDDFRRNMPTNHKVFGEAIAILAGDALLTEAFGIIARQRSIPSLLLKVVREITLSCGTNGMVGGQTADIISENKRIREKDLIYIHSHKTGTFIKSSVRIGAIMGDAPPEILRALSRYGEKIGLAYQVIDDILDVTGTKKELGKQTGADLLKGKNTYPSFYGLHKSKQIAGKLIQEALRALKGFDTQADPLREIAEYILKRRN